VNVRPAIVSVPVRAAPTFDANRYETLPFPVPVAPDVIVIHEALLSAVHGHVLIVDTPTVPVPSPTGTLSPDDEIE
jgi:hypothetical protein